MIVSRGLRKTKFEGHVSSEGWRPVVSEPWDMGDGFVIQRPDVEVDYVDDGYGVTCPNCGENIFLGDLPHGKEDVVDGECDNCGTEIEVEAYWDIRVDDVKARTPEAKKDAGLDEGEVMEEKKEETCEVCGFVHLYVRKHDRCGKVLCPEHMLEHLASCYKENVRRV